MQRMEESGPLPVYGMPKVSRTACTVPSSPPGPCRHTKAASGSSSMSFSVVLSSTSKVWISWPRRSRACATRWPVTSETSRSIEWPPLKTTRRDIKLPLLLPPPTCRGGGRGGVCGVFHAPLQVAPELHPLPDHLGEDLYSAPDLLGLDEREVEAHTV